MRSLLDVNVLIALLDEDHLFHSVAHEWWQRFADGGWASCPLVENGTARIMSAASYPTARRFRVAEVVEAISIFVSGSNHEFWPDALSLRNGEFFAVGQLLSGRHLTDLYLLGLAAHRGARLVTFDRSIPISAVPKAAPENLFVL